MFKLEQEEYIKEKITWSSIDFPDNQVRSVAFLACNPCFDIYGRSPRLTHLSIDVQLSINPLLLPPQDCLDLIEAKKPAGLLAILDDMCLLQKVR